VALNADRHAVNKSTTPKWLTSKMRFGCRGPVFGRCRPRAPAATRTACAAVSRRSVTSALLAVPSPTPTRWPRIRPW